MVVNFSLLTSLALIGFVNYQKNIEKDEDRKDMALTAFLCAT
jgi:hypothetical protein